MNFNRFITCFCALFLFVANSLIAQDTLSSYRSFHKDWRKAHSSKVIFKALDDAVHFAIKTSDTIALQKAYQYKLLYSVKLNYQDSLDAYFFDFQNINRALKDNEGQDYAFRKKVIFYYNSGGYFKALKAAEEGLELAINVKEPKKQSFYLRYIAAGQTKLGLYFEAESAVIHGLKILDEIQNSEFVTEAKIGYYNQLGIIYKTRQQFAEARNYYEKSLALTNQLSQKLTLKNNIANLYAEEGDFEKTASIFFELLATTDSVTNPKKYARALDNLGFTLTRLHKPSALFYLKRGLVIREKIGYQLGLFSSYYHLAKYYEDVDDKSKAITMAQQSLVYAQKINSLESRLDAYRLLIQLGEDHTAAQYLKINDSLEKAIRLESEKYIAYKYNYRLEHEAAEKNRIKFVEAELKGKIANQHKTIWQLVAILAFCGFAGGFWVYRNYRRRKAQKEIYDTETRIGKQIHDEIANDIYQTMQKVEYSNLEEEELLNRLDDIYQRSRNISKANSSIVTNDDFQQVLQELLNSYQSEALILVTTGMNTIDWHQFSEARKVCIYRVLQELMTNMRKHSKATLVRVAFEMQQKKIQITYTDNGVGTSDFSKSGLLHAENRIKAVKGSVIFTTAINQGFKAVISI